MTQCKGCNFRLFKINFERSKYLQLLADNMIKSLLKFRTRNRKLPIETGPEYRFQKENASSVLIMSVMSITICYVVRISVLKEIVH